MNYILRILFLLFVIMLPSMIWAQSDSFVPRSKIVRDRSLQWLNSEGRRFQSEADSLNYIRAMIGADTTKYESMEEALLDINDLLNKVESNETTLRGKNEGLSLRIYSIISQNKEKAKVADDAYMELLKKDTTSVADFLELKRKFGNRPTYYVNDKQVGQDMLDRIKESYILNRDIRVANTLSGNPNGEVWIEITPKAAQRLRLDEYVYRGENAVSVYPENSTKEDSLTKKIPKDTDIKKKAESQPGKSDNKKEIKPAISEEDSPNRSVRRVKQNIQDKK